MRSVIGVASLAVAAAFVTACASRPTAPVPPPAAAPVTAPRPAPVSAPAPVAPQPSGPIAGSRADFAAKAKDRVYFGYDQSSLDEASKRVLQSQAQWLTTYPSTRIQVEGNADERGTREYNRALGFRRAQAVKDYLGTLGVTGTRVETYSWGKDKPVSDGHDEASWSLNRNAYTNVVTEAGRS